MNGGRGQKNGSSTPDLIAILILTVIVIAGGVSTGRGLISGRQEESTSSVQLQTEEAPEQSMTESEVPESEPEETEIQTEAAPSPSPPMMPDVTRVVKKAMPSVVSITNKSVQEITYMFRGTMEIENESSGSGIIIAQTDDELLIATNYHVVEDASTLTVCFTVDTDEEEDALVPAVVKGADEQYDLAVVAVDSEEISREVEEQIAVATLGSSSDLTVGDPAIAIGNALGYGQSVTFGIISALNRSIEVDGETYTFIQTDAAINFGNSGGALLNEEGEVIGINSAKAASSGVEGMGYAIPIDEAEPILAALMDRETRQKVDADERGYLGIYAQDISSEARNLYDIPNGVYVTHVAEGSPAEKAGLLEGDIISSMDGLSVSSADRFEELQEYYRAGEKIVLVILRANMGKYVSQEMELKFAEQPEQNDAEQGIYLYGNRSPF